MTCASYEHAVPLTKRMPRLVEQQELFVVAASIPRGKFNIAFRGSSLQATPTILAIRLAHIPDPPLVPAMFVLRLAARLFFFFFA